MHGLIPLRRMKSNFEINKLRMNRDHGCSMYFWLEDAKLCASGHDFDVIKK